MRPGYGVGEPLTGFAAITDAQQCGHASALATWAAVADVHFTQRMRGTRPGIIRVAGPRWPASELAGLRLPARHQRASADILAEPRRQLGFSPGGYGYMALIHGGRPHAGAVAPFDIGLGGTLPHG